MSTYLDIINGVADALVHDGTHQNRHQAIFAMSGDPEYSALFKGAHGEPLGVPKQMAVRKEWRRSPEHDVIIARAEELVRQGRAATLDKAIEMVASMNPQAYVDYARTVQGEKPSWRR